MYVEKLKDFAAIPRKIKKDYLEGKISKPQKEMLLWVFISTDPFHGYYSTSYRELAEEFKENKEDKDKAYGRVRKIISDLRKKKLIWFPDHRGKKDYLFIIPMYFRNTKKWQYLPEEFDFIHFKEKERVSIHNPDTQNHNSNNSESKNLTVIQPLASDPEKSLKNPFTTPYIETKNETNNLD
jgi:hypothetical protein